MNIDNLEQVNLLVKIKAKCLKAQDDLVEFIETSRGAKDPGGLYGYDVGYYAQLYKHSDSSGPGADMSGCYVGIQVAQATTVILSEQIARIDEDLKKLGVDV